MIDPIHSLAFSLQSNRGIYAVLLGSGVSRSSGILTGWEITLDLIRKVAVLHGETIASEPESWYQEKFGKEPDYSELLENLAKTAAERQQLLRSYWEPNEQEREEGKKTTHCGTPCHCSTGCTRFCQGHYYDEFRPTD